MRPRAFLTLLALLAGATACAAPMSAHRAIAARLPVAGAALAERGPIPVETGSRHVQRDSATVQAFVATRSADLRYCATDARRAEPTLAGRMRLEVVIAPDGYVYRARAIEGAWEGDGSALEACALATVRRWVFPAIDPLDEGVHTFAVEFGR